MKRLALAISLLASLVLPASAEFGPLLLIDEDSIDNSAPAILELAAENTCGGGNSAICVNDQIANPGVRVPLPIPAGTIIGDGVVGGTTAKLFTGQINDEGWFLLSEAPQSWVDAGPSTEGLFNYLIASQPGFGLNGEFLLDNIPNLIPQRTAELQQLVGRSFCAVVYDSDISYDTQTFEANLQGANLGILALTVLAVGPDPAGSVLPDVTIRVDDPARCQTLLATEESTWGRIKTIFRD